MQKFYCIKSWILILLSTVVITILTAIGRGIPFFNILFGFVVGWYAVKRAFILYKDLKERLLKTFIYCLFCSGVTLIFMLIIWGSQLQLLFNPLTDFRNYGHPMILYEPKLSFIGWLILMIIISPFLQLTSSIFSAFITLTVDLKRNSKILN